MRVCEKPGCEKRHYAKGYCVIHYRRLLTTGSTDLKKRVGYDRRGDKNPKWRGGKSSHPLYLIYHDMIARCRRETHARYFDYGGRGIDVCQEWVDDFWKFVEDVGERPEGKTKGGRAYWQLDRIDNDGNYEPGNVRWATPAEQRENTRERTLQAHCRKGHVMDEQNTYVNKRTGARKCRQCQKLVESRRERKWVSGHYITIPRGTRQGER